MSSSDSTASGSPETVTPTVLDYFREELDSLRGRAIDFAGEYPGVAAELALSGGHSADPHVELLMQSFGFLTGRLRHRIDAESPELSNALLALMAEPLSTPTPSMGVVQFEVDPNKANFELGYTLPRHTQMSVKAKAFGGHETTCRFRTAYATPLWPLEVTACGRTARNQYDDGDLGGAPKPGEARSVIRIRVAATADGIMPELSLKHLRFYIDGGESVRSSLYDLVATQLERVVMFDVTPNGDGGKGATLSGAQREDFRLLRTLPKSSVRMVGFEDDEALLPEGIGTHPSNRVLQEFFCLPDKFHFVDIKCRDPLQARGELEIVLVFRTDPDGMPTLKPEHLRLNCTPVVNLFSLTCDPIRLDHRRLEYPVVVDSRHHRTHELYSVLSVQATRPGQTAKEILPFFSLDPDADDAGVHYTIRRSVSESRALPGTEVAMAFHDHQLSLARPVADAIHVRGLCTNRDLCESLRKGDTLDLDGGGPVKMVSLLQRPTNARAPKQQGQDPWHLISVLSLNRFSILGEEGGLETLKRVLRLFAHDEDPVATAQIESVLELTAEPTVRYIGDERWRGFCQGEKVLLKVDEKTFRGCSPVLFAEVIRRFLGSQMSLNSFVQLELHSKRGKGAWRSWMPLAGAQTLV